MAVRRSTSNKKSATQIARSKKTKNTATRSTRPAKKSLSTARNKKNAAPARGARARRAKTTETLRAISAEQNAALEQAAQTSAPVDNIVAEAPARATPSPDADIKRILDSANRLGVEVKEHDAIQWLTAIAAVQNQSSVTVDIQNDIFGSAIAMLDFAPEDLDHFRRIGKIVRIADQPGVVETALALSGSAAQSRIQKYPGDADYFQRVNIKTATREECVRILADAMRQKALDTLRGSDHQLLTVKFGTFHELVTREGKEVKPGSPMTWSPDQVVAGEFKITSAGGVERTVRWEDGMTDPGWCKFDWVVADPPRGQLANASNLLDVTWEAPDGTITPLDGMIDPYFQEVYLDAASVPVFSKLVKHVDTNALKEYIAALEGEIYKYLVRHPNYGKVAKRSYNVFRLTGRFPEAAYLRELFDEPTTALYQVWSLFDTLSAAERSDSQLDRAAMLKQYDRLIEQVIGAVEGATELEIVRALMRARDDFAGVAKMDESLDQAFAASSADVATLLNRYFKDRLYGFDTIGAYLDEILRRNAS